LNPSDKKALFQELTIEKSWQHQDLVDLACGNLADHLNLADPAETVFLDIQPILTILKALFLPQPLTSIQEVSWKKFSKCAGLLLTGRAALSGVFRIPQT
jgi:hypothetical protein